MKSFDLFQLAGLTLIYLKNETKADAERDLRELISLAGADVAEKARRERLLRHLESANKAVFVLFRGSCFFWASTIHEFTLKKRKAFVFAPEE